MNRFLRVPAALIGFLVGACGHTPSVAAPEPLSGTVRLQVDSHSPDSLEILVLNQGGGVHVGVATRSRLPTWTISLDQFAPGGSLRLEARAVGQRRAVQPAAVTVKPGQLVIWTIERDLGHGSFEVF